MVRMGRTVLIFLARFVAFWRLEEAIDHRRIREWNSIFYINANSPLSPTRVCDVDRSPSRPCRGIKKKWLASGRPKFLILLKVVSGPAKNWYLTYWRKQTCWPQKRCRQFSSLVCVSSADQVRVVTWHIPNASVFLGCPNCTYSMSIPFPW